MPTILIIFDHEIINSKMDEVTFEHQHLNKSNLFSNFVDPLHFESKKSIKNLFLIKYNFRFNIEFYSQQHAVRLKLNIILYYFLKMRGIPKKIDNTSVSK